MTDTRFSCRAYKAGDRLRSQCVVLPIAKTLTLDGAAQRIDQDSGGIVSRCLASGDFKGSAGQSLMLHAAGDAARILLVGTGEGGPGRDALRKASAAAARALLGSKASDALFLAVDLKLKADESQWLAQRLARDLIYEAYRYRLTRSKPKPDASLRRFTLLAADARSVRAFKKGLELGSEIGSGINLARELANRPGNHCTPEDLAKEARRLARGQDKVSCKVLNEKAMAELGMHSLLSVTAGTATPARLIVLEYKGGKRGDAPHVLVGKGITFDSGGISLKPGAKMDEMKFDMGGAASVLGTLQAVIGLKLPINVVGIIAAAENMPSGTATKPGDVVTSMAGITIEILNTDAEGRLVLCDALTYAARFKPATVVDIATLTGACVVALGNHASGLYANDDKLAEQLLEAGTEAHDRAWRMPLWEDYQKQLESNFADVANIGGPGAGSVTAACFLARFTKDYRWAHLDIAGSAWDSSPKGATGRPVGLLTQYLCDRAAD
ncbi:MAG: leucyl aminopeptidase [Halieaceae bacterium]|jgi:leucyl aminopeptidase|nr:leucyl aminopeptidase [Halieaceae bacterium]